jgi:hypothetical protein
VAGYTYHGENHDWDLVLRAANVVLQSAQHFRDKREIAFSSQMASMLLSFTAIESFTASIAFKMDQSEAFQLNFARFAQLRGFWAKVNAVCEAAHWDSQADAEPFRQMRNMHEWRNNLVHSRPSRVVETDILDPQEIHELHKPFHNDEAVRFVNEENCVAYFNAAKAYVDELERLTGIQPRSFAAYKVN